MSDYRSVNEQVRNVPAPLLPPDEVTTVHAGSQSKMVHDLRRVNELLRGELAGQSTNYDEKARQLREQSQAQQELNKHKRVNNQVRGELAGKKTSHDDPIARERVQVTKLEYKHNGQILPGAVVVNGAEDVDASAFDDMPEWVPESAQITGRGATPVAWLPRNSETPLPPELKPWQLRQLQMDEERKRNATAPVRGGRGTPHVVPTETTAGLFDRFFDNFNGGTVAEEE